MWDQGLNQERAVAQKVDQPKSKGWFVLHDVPLGVESFDHLVIGPGGVYSIDVHMHMGAKVWIDGDYWRVDGEDLDLVPQARERAKLSSRLLTEAVSLEVSIGPILVPLNGEPRLNATNFFQSTQGSFNPVRKEDR